MAVHVVLGRFRGGRQILVQGETKWKQDKTIQRDAQTVLSSRRKSRPDKKVASQVV
jgi:hypothetical protein